MPPELLPMPVEAEIAGHRAQPRREARRTVRPEVAQPAKAIPAQLLADEQVAVACGVFISFEEPDDVEEERGLGVEEAGPGLAPVTRTKLTEYSVSLRVVHRRHPVPSWGRTRRQDREREVTNPASPLSAGLKQRIVA
jgi:hypothetical protein